MAYCPKPGCEYASKGKGVGGFPTKVQREVDIAIAIRPVKAKIDHPTMKNLILLAGDGDFTDMVKFMKDTFNVRVLMFAWSASVNYDILQKVSDVVYLDEIFDKISTASLGG